MCVTHAHTLPVGVCVCVCARIQPTHTKPADRLLLCHVLWALTSRGMQQLIPYVIIYCWITSWTTRQDLAMLANTWDMSGIILTHSFVCKARFLLRVYSTIAQWRYEYDLISITPFLLYLPASDKFSFPVFSSIHRSINYRQFPCPCSRKASPQYDAATAICCCLPWSQILLDDKFSRELLW